MISGKKTVALYTRVSTGYQIDKDSLPFQKKTKSGKNTDRLAFLRMMKKIRTGEISYVVVYKIDRISQNPLDFSVMYDKFKKYRVTFISLNEQFDTSSAIGRSCPENHPCFR